MAAVEVATGSLDTKSIERERTSRRVKAAASCSSSRSDGHQQAHGRA